MIFWKVFLSYRMKVLYGQFTNCYIMEMLKRKSNHSSPSPRGQEAPKRREDLRRESKLNFAKCKYADRKSNSRLMGRKAGKETKHKAENRGAG